MQRQVVVSGRVEPVDRAETEAYFASRPRGSQLGAWASPSPQVVPDRAALDEAYRAAAERFAGGRAGAGARRTGVGCGCGRRRWSSGRAGPAGCTTGCGSAGVEAGDWVVERLAP